MSDPYVVNRLAGRVVSVTRTADGAFLPAAAPEVVAWAAAGQPPVSLADAFDLASCQAQKIAAIDARTMALLAAGFPYATGDGKGTFAFALDQTVQTTWLGLFNAAQAGLLVYPQLVGTLDNRTAYLSGLADVQAWYATGTRRAATVITQGTALKTQAQAAKDQAGVDAVIDTRS